MRVVDTVDEIVAESLFLSFVLDGPLQNYFLPALPFSALYTPSSCTKKMSSEVTCQMMTKCSLPGNACVFYQAYAFEVE